MTVEQIVRGEEVEIERFEALGLGRYDAILAVDSGVDRHAVELLVTERGCTAAAAIELAR